MDADEYKARVRESMGRGLARSHTVDLHGYPEDVADLIGLVCELWSLKPPATRKGRGYWIASAIELKDACGEFGLEAIRDYRRYFMMRMEENKRRTGYGAGPHDVDSPNSLVNPVRGHTGRMREAKASEVSRDNTLPSAVYEIKGAVVSVGGRRFYNGKELIDERP